jgi:hypothetical protein
MELPQWTCNFRRNWFQARWQAIIQHASHLLVFLASDTLSGWSEQALFTVTFAAFHFVLLVPC